MAWYDIAGVALGVIGSMLQLWIITLQTLNSPQTEFLLFPGSDGLFQLAIYDNEDYRVPFHSTQDVKFLLYTPSNRKKAFRIFVNNVKILRTSPFMPNIPVRIFIHGFGMSTRLGKFATKIIKTFMAEDADPCNLIHVDWEKSAMAPLYNTAAANSKDVGHEISKLVHFLISNGANLSTVHIVGFSMGAHVAGFAAKHFKKNYGQMLPRVTGLDPALPWYFVRGASNRLDFTDADFVDVIHTNGKSSSTFVGLGIHNSIGHADFFVNGGDKQTGCEGLLNRARELRGTNITNRKSTKCRVLLFPGSDGLFQVAIYDNEDYRVPFHPTQDVKFLLYTPKKRKIWVRQIFSQKEREEKDQIRMGNVATDQIILFSEFF